MTIPTNTKAEAERKIAVILQQLEIDTGDVVESIGVYDIETTQIESDRTQILRQVLIITHRFPGSRWEI